MTVLCVPSLKEEPWPTLGPGVCRFIEENLIECAKADYIVADGALIVLGFDGALYEDSTALIGTEIETGFQWPLGIWEKPPHIRDWKVPDDEVDAVMRDTFEKWDVWRLNADPYMWQGWLAQWAGVWGEKVVSWATNRWRLMAYAVLNFQTAIQSGGVSHDGDPVFSQHIGNAYRREITLKDDQGRPMWVIQKERRDSPHKMDAAMAATLSWEARTMAIAEGASGTGSRYEEEGVDIFVV